MKESEIGFFAERFWDVECRMWDVGCEMWDVGCGMWDVVKIKFCFKTMCFIIINLWVNKKNSGFWESTVLLYSF